MIYRMKINNDCDTSETFILQHLRVYFFAKHHKNISPGSPDLYLHPFAPLTTPISGLSEFAASAVFKKQS